MYFPQPPCLESLEPRRLLAAAAAADPLFNDPGMYGLRQIDAPGAWVTTTGSSSIVVAGIDSGVDFAHPDLYLNTWINPGEVPFPIGIAGGLVQAPGSEPGVLTFGDLNHRLPSGSPANSAFVSDLNHNGYIDGEDLIFDSRWVNGIDDDGNGYVDDLVGWDFANNDNDPYDFDGHGTHTAGTIAAIGDNGIGIRGIAPGVRIMPLKIFSDNGGGAGSGVISEAIRYAADNGARISNNSYGASYGADGDTISSAIAYAANRDHLFIAAAGNEGRLIDQGPERSYPAVYNIDQIISVGAGDSARRRAAFSNFGVASVDVFAPGVGILSTVPGGYARFSGTSMAAPHVSGAAALLLSRDPSMSALEVKDRLLNTVDRDPELTYFASAGGWLNVGRAMNLAGLAGSTSTYAVGSTLTKEGLRALAALGQSPSTAGSSLTFSDTPLADVLEDTDDALLFANRQLV